ncbi:hypothetical protein [Streptomyces marispadix]|nr:hypothetical protein [Streptomyces marispadix]
MTRQRLTARMRNNADRAAALALCAFAGAIVVFLIDLGAPAR